MECWTFIIGSIKPRYCHLWIKMLGLDRCGQTRSVQDLPRRASQPHQRGGDSGENPQQRQQPDWSQSQQHQGALDWSGEKEQPDTRTQRNELTWMRYILVSVCCRTFPSQRWKRSSRRWRATLTWRFWASPPPGATTLWPTWETFSVFSVL